MCGGDFDIKDSEKVATCLYCGTKQTLPDVDEEKTLQLYNRATYQLSVHDYDKASSIYEKIISDQGEQAEAYWGLCLCKYGIEYVTDPTSGKKIPTCHRTILNSILKDNDYLKAIELSDPIARALYCEEAKYIDGVQKKILEISKEEEPYDIFICYKETDKNKKRTIDSVISEEIYDALTEKGYRVFFSKVSLEDKLGMEYEPYIFSALNSSKIMLVVGTKEEYFNAAWVKNEWSRFITMMKNDKNKILIPCYKDISPYDMPEEFINLQSQDLSKLGYIQDLLKGIQKLLKKNRTVGGTSEENDKTIVLASKIAKANTYLSKGQFEEADELADEIVKIDPKCAEGYVIKFKVENKIDSKDLPLVCSRDDIRFSDHFRKAVEFADDELKNKLNFLQNEVLYSKNKEEYDKAKRLLRDAYTPEDYKKPLSIFKKIKGFLNSDSLAKECMEGMYCNSEYSFLKKNVPMCIKPYMNNDDKNSLLEAFKYIRNEYGDLDAQNYIDNCDAISKDDVLEKLECELASLNNEISAFYASSDYTQLKEDYDIKKGKILELKKDFTAAYNNKKSLLEKEKTSLRNEMAQLSTEISRCGLFQIKLKKELRAKLSVVELDYSKASKAVSNFPDISQCDEMKKINTELHEIEQEYTKLISDKENFYEIEKKKNRIEEIESIIREKTNHSKDLTIWNPDPYIRVRDTAGFISVYITIGNYPQTKVDSLELVEKLNNITPDKNDIVNFIGLKFQKFNDDYFMFKPIQWRVIYADSSKNKQVAFVISRNSLDFKAPIDLNNLDIRWDGKVISEILNKRTGGVACSYEGSDIRSWLNGYFYEIAFNEIEKKMLCQAQITESLNGKKQVLYDKVFLPSYKSVRDEPFANEANQIYDEEELFSEITSWNLVNYSFICNNLNISSERIDIDEYDSNSLDDLDACMSAEHYILKNSEFVEYKNELGVDAESIVDQSPNWLLRDISESENGLMEVITNDCAINLDGDQFYDIPDSVIQVAIRPSILIGINGALEEPIKGGPGAKFNF